MEIPKIGEHHIIRGKNRKLYAKAAFDREAQKDADILRNRGYEGVLITSRKAVVKEGVTSMRKISNTVYLVWAISKR